MFDDAATRLNMKSLLGFMSELVFCSHKQLLTIHPKRVNSSKANKKQARNCDIGAVGNSCFELIGCLVQDSGGLSCSSSVTQSSCSTLLFHRISEAMLKCIRSGRPLLHIVQAWAVVGPHLMEVTAMYSSIEYNPNLMPMSSPPKGLLP